MLLILLALLPLLLAIVYYVWQLHNARGWALAKSPVGVEPSVESPSLALVIPFRNEAANLPEILRSIAGFRYSGLEVIFVDDHSEDQGAVLVGGAAGARLRGKRQGPPIRLLALADHLRGQTVTAYKKAALAYAISQTEAEVIITTDADCRLPAGFPDDIARAFRAGSDVVCGPVLISPTAGFLASFQAVDFIAYQLYTASCVARQKPTLANGACFAFRRQLFERVNGYQGMDHLPSGDDVLLLHKFAQVSDVRFGWHAGMPVFTTSVPSWAALWRQRIRWAGKAGAYVSRDLQLGQALAYLTSLSLLAGVIAGMFNGWFLLPTAIAWLVKISIDDALLTDISAHYRQQVPAHHVILTHLLHPVYLVVIGTAALLGVKTGWKGRA